MRDKMDIYTYHLDQNIRGKLSKRHLDLQFLDKPYKKEAILPVALLEYAGIKGIKKIMKSLAIPQALINQNLIDIAKIKKYWEDDLKKKISMTNIKTRLKDRQGDNEYAEPFTNKCIEILPKIYNLLIAQLSWDRFSYMKWSEHISDEQLLRNIREQIVTLIAKQNLYALRHFSYLSNKFDFLDINNKNEDVNHLKRIIKRAKVEPNVDIGDCEFIHTAINGQSSSNLEKRVIVDCYTMDPIKEIKRRLIACFSFYYLMERHSTTYRNFQYKFEPQYCGNIYAVDEEGRTKEKIQVIDYHIEKVFQKIGKRELEILFLQND